MAWLVQCSKDAGNSSALLVMDSTPSAGVVTSLWRNYLHCAIACSESRTDHRDPPSTGPETPHKLPAAAASTAAAGHKMSSSNATNLHIKDVRAMLDDLADQYLSDSHTVVSDRSGSHSASPRKPTGTVAKNLFKQMVLAMLPCRSDRLATAEDLSIDSNLLAAAATAAAAAAAAGLEQHPAAGTFGIGSDVAVIWATQQLTPAAEEISQQIKGQPAAEIDTTSSSSSGTVEASAASREAVSKLLSPRVVRPAFAASPGAAAAAFLGALGHVTLPVDLVVQVLVQCEELVTAAEWRVGLAAATAAPADYSLQDSAPDQHESEAADQQAQLLTLLLLLVQHVQLQRIVNAQAPRIYAAILAAAAAEVHARTHCVVTTSYLGMVQQYEQQLTAVLTPLVQAMLSGNSSSDGSGPKIDTTAGPGMGLSAFAAVQMILEFSRSSSATMGSIPAEEVDYIQLLVLSSVVPAMLKHYSAAGGLSLFVSSLSSQAHETASVLQQLYLLLLLQPHLRESDLQSAVAKTPLMVRSRRDVDAQESRSDAAAAVVALQNLCNVLEPGSKIPLANYAELLTAAVRGTHSRDAKPNEADRRLPLLATMAVLGTFRGARKMVGNVDVNSMVEGSSQPLPHSDLAAVLHYSGALLPAATAAKLAAAIGPALRQPIWCTVVSVLKALLRMLACYFLILMLGACCKAYVGTPAGRSWVLSTLHMSMTCPCL